MITSPPLTSYVDHWMDELFQDIPLRKSLLKLLKNKEDSILAMTAAHGIGNLVRKGRFSRSTFKVILPKA